MAPDSESLETPSGTSAEAGNSELLREFAETGADAAFARLVKRHVDLVFSAALRQTSNHATAQDVTQAVFTILARKAGSLRRETILAGWLLRAVRFAALDARKLEARRHRREQEAAQMHLTHSDTESGDDIHWEQLAPRLDEALAALGARDRHAVLLRFFEKKSFGEIGSTLGGNENSARVRVVRAVEKLRGYFRKHGIAVSAAVLSALLTANSVHAAPPALTASLSNGLAPDTLADTLLRRLFWRRWFRVAVVLLILLLLSGGASALFRQRQLARAATVAADVRAVRELMIAIDRTYTLNDPEGFVGLLRFRDDERRQFAPVLTDYIRAESLFRREMMRVLNVRQRTFNVTFSELCFWQPGEPATHFRADSVVTNIMTARYPVHFVKVEGAWKWDLFDGLTPVQREQRIALLRHKAAVLTGFAQQVHDGATTNVTEILDTVHNAKP
jgi:RNA polymerase sigma factor (sigma-70 family)